MTPFFFKAIWFMLNIHQVVYAVLLDFVQVEHVLELHLLTVGGLPGVGFLKLLLLIF